MPEYQRHVYICVRRRRDEDGLRTNFLDELGNWIRADEFDRAVGFTNMDQAWELIANKGHNFDSWRGWEVDVVLEETARQMAVEQAMVGDP